MISNRSVPPNTVLPHIFYADVAEAVSWLAGAFGFTEHYRYGDPGGPPSGAQMWLRNAWIMLRRARTGSASPAQLGYGTQSLTVFIEDVGEHFQKAKSAGVRIIEDLHETEYGELQYGAVGLAGRPPLALFAPCPRRESGRLGSRGLRARDHGSANFSHARRC